MVADPASQPVEAEPAEDDPQLQCAEAAAELGRVLVEVPLRAVADPVDGAEVLGHQAERVADDVEPATQEQRRIDRRPEPLVRVDDDRVRPLPAAERGSQPGVDRDGARRRRRRRGARALRGLRRRRSPRRGRRTSTTSCRRVATMAIGRRPAARSDAIASSSAVGPHLEPVVRRDADEGRAAQAQGHARLVDRGMGLLRGVDPERGHVRSPGDPRPPRRRSRRPAGPPARAINDDVDAVSVRRPSNASGSPSAWRSQSTTTCSSSVPLGDVRHSIGFWPSAATSISPRIPGPDAVDAK